MYTAEFDWPVNARVNRDFPRLSEIRALAVRHQNQIAVALGDWAIGWFDSRGNWHGNPQYQDRTLCVNCGSHVESPADPDPICGCCGREWAVVDDFLPVR